MILLIVLSSLLMVTVTIYQYDEQTKEYNVQRFGRKEEATKEDIDIELENAIESGKQEKITTRSIPIVFEESIYEISSVHNLDMTMYDLKGNYLATSSASIFMDSIQRPLKDSYSS